MEIRDLYDENKTLINKTIKKGEPIPKGKYYLTVVVWIQNNKGEFLLQINKKYHLWSTTGGHPKTKESSLDGIINEIKEELGINIDPRKLFLFKTIKTEDDFIDLYYLKKDILLSEITLQKEEVEDVKWATTNAIKSMIINNNFLPSHIEFFNCCLEFLNKDNN